VRERLQDFDAGSRQVRLKAVEWFGAVRGSFALDELIQVVGGGDSRPKDVHGDVRLRAVRVAAEIGSSMDRADQRFEMALKVLERGLNDNDRIDVRAASALAMGSLADARSWEALNVRLTGETRPVVQSAIRDAMRAIEAASQQAQAAEDTPEPAPDLERVLETDEELEPA